MTIRIPLLRVDHRARIDFYVREGLLPTAPSDEQLGRALDAMKSKVGVLGQMIFYTKNPGLILPSKAKRRFVDNPRSAGDDRPRLDATGEFALQRSQLPAVDRFLSWLFLFSPAKFAAKTLCNPWETIPASGLNTPAWCLISHVLQTTHPPPGIWDIQVLHPDPGALDALEQRVDRVLSRRGFRSRVDRALGDQPNQFEDLKSLIPKIRRFDYPPVPEGVDDRNENLVSFLRHAATL